MSVISWIVLIFALLVISLVMLFENSQRKLEQRKIKWQEEENCQINEIPGSKLESWYYKSGGKEIFVEVTWADMKSGFRISMNGFSDSSTTIPIEENKMIAACMLKYLGFVRGAKTLKLSHKGLAYPSDELIEQIENKIKPLGYNRVIQDESEEITWSKK